MKQKRYTEEQIVYALKQVGAGEKITDLCRQMGVSEATFYNWRKKYEGMCVSEVRELRQLREENQNREEQVDVQALVTHATIEALDVAVLGRFSRADEVEAHVAAISPGVHLPAVKLGAVIDTDRLRQRTVARYCFELSDDLRGVHAVLGPYAERLTREGVN